MKRDKHKSEEQAPEVSPPPANPNGIDFLVVLQVGAGVLCIVFFVWMFLHFILKVF